MLNKMKSVFAFPLRLMAFWLLFFAVFRVWFVAWFHREWSPGEPSSAWKALWYALPLDVSTAGYLMAVPVLLWFAGLAAGEQAHSVVSKAISSLNIIFISILVLVFGSNIFIYEEWHTLLNNRALDYMSTPRALLDSMSLPFKIVSVGLYFGFLWLMWQAYKKIVGTNIFPEKKSRNSLFAMPISAGLLFLAIRGGLGVIPINESAVYYSSHLFNNHAANNTAWNLIHSLIETRSTVNHYRFLPQQEAAAEVRGLLGGNLDAGQPELRWLEQSDSSPVNLVFIIMESMTAQVVEELGGEPGVDSLRDRDDERRHERDHDD